MRRFYISPEVLPAVDTPNQWVGQHITLPDEVYHHGIRVLRAQINDTFTVFNGVYGEYVARLISVSNHTAIVRLESFNAIQRTNPFRSTLGLVVSKGDRMDYALQKATELGVSQVQLLYSARCEERLKYARDQKKMVHWQGVMIAACEQCGLNALPILHAPIELYDWLNTLRWGMEDKALVLTPELNTSAAFDGRGEVNKHYVLLVGAEGGLSDAEIQQAIQHGFIPWQLGERVLRTETAPVVALSSLLATVRQKM